MINLLVGAPGGGKSYEAVVYHVLTALTKGRKVITNLALNLDAFALIDASYVDLIEIRTATLAVRPAVVARPDAQTRFMARLGLDAPEKTFNGAAFSHVEDFGDTWRHPDTGAGPLYVVDECHISLPKSGTPVPVEEWFSLHRHEFADVLLISQSYGKLNAAIRDLVQVVYRVRKNVALGSSGSYTRKVQDGIRGEVVNTAVRRYQARFFPLYQSHTKSGAGVEMGAADIIPLWRHWSVWGVGVIAVLIAVQVAVNGNPFRIFATKTIPAPVSATQPGMAAPVHAVPSVVSPVVPVATPAPVVEEKRPLWPYGALQLHVGGVLRSARKTIFVIVFSQNGQKVFSQTDSEMVQAGYKVSALNDCLVSIQFEKLQQYISCDAPSMGIGRSAIHPDRPQS